MKRNITLAIAYCISSLVYSQNQDIYTKIDSVFNSINAKEPGISIGVIKNDKLIYSYQKGMANLEYNIPIEKKTIFGLASITKQMTAACIGILEHQKKLNIEDDVRKYIPELPKYGNIIKIKHLLNHTSGLRNHNVLLNLQGFDYNHSGYTNKSIQKLIYSQKNVNNKPGEKFLYTNSNYVLLALIIERVSNEKIEDFAKTHLFEPLDMNHTFYKKSLGQIIKNKAYSYYKEKGIYKQTTSLTHCIGAGGVGSTVNDMSKWSHLFTSKNPKLPYITKFITTLDTLNNGHKMNFARGVIISPYNGYQTINHSGRDLGMRSQLISVPAEKLSLILFSNSEHVNVVNLSYKVLDLFLQPKEEKNIEEKSYQHSLSELRRLSGDYQEINSDLGMKILIEDNLLKAKSSFGNTPILLKEVARNKFKRAENSSVGYHFFVGNDKKCDLEIDFGGAKFYFERVILENPEHVKLTDYAGNYYAEELNVNYQIFIENGKLYRQYPNNPKIELILGQKDEFGSQNRTRYRFIRKNKSVIGFSIASEGTVKDILFYKNK